MTRNKFQSFRLLETKCLTKTRFSKKRKKKISFVLLILFQWFSFGFAIKKEEHFLDRNQKNSSEIFFCENCEISEEKFRLREIRSEILGKLGMTEEPKNFLEQRSVKRKEFFYETNLFHESEIKINELDDVEIEEKEFITYAKIGGTYKSSRLIEFSPHTDLEDRSRKSFYQIKEAFLYFKITPNLDEAENTKNDYSFLESSDFKIWIFEIIDEETLNLISRQPVKSSAWQKIDITFLIKNWYSAYSIEKPKNLQLLIDCTGCSQRRLRHKQIKIFKHFDNQTKLNSFLSKKRNPKHFLFQNSPFLVTAVKKTRKKGSIRKKRHLKCSGETKTGECCLQPFYVSFKNLGWENWIVAPSGYFSNYCRGKCSLGNGSYRQSNYQRFFSNFDTNFEKCCAPVKFSKMSLIYYGDDGGLVKRDLEKMVVEECACFF